MTAVQVQDADAPLPGGFDALVRACELADDHGPFGEHTLLTLHGQRQVRHARIAAVEAGGLAGFAVLSEGIESWYVELAVSPDRRRRGVGTALLAACREHVASHGGGLLRGWAHASGAEVDGLVRDWTVSRSLLVLEREPADSPPSAPPPVMAVPDGMRLRTLDPACGTDRDAWLELSNSAFAGHPENGGWTRDEVDWRMAADWTDGSRFPVVQEGERLVAGVWIKAVDPSPSEAGTGEACAPELYVVAVAPDRQGRGLGRLVVAEALRLLRTYGTTTLYVDADNVAALALYRRAGFVLHHRDRCFQTTVPARVVQTS